MRKLFLIPLAIILFSSCKKNTNETSAKNIQGVVYLYNEFGQRLPNAAGVTVVLEYVGDTAITDSAGGFSFTSKYLPAVSYTIMYSKSGYGTYQQNFTIAANTANTTVPNAAVYANSTTVITNLAATIDTAYSSGGYYTIYLTGALTPAGTTQEPRNMIVFTGPTPDVSPTNYANAWFIGTTIYGTLKVYVSNVPGGQTLYLVGYGISMPTSSTAYQDPTTGKFVYPSICSTPSNVASIALP